MTPRRPRLLARPLLAFWLRRLLTLWCLIAFMIVLVQIAVCGIVHDNENVKAMLRIIDLLPAFIKSDLGGEALQTGNISGLITIGYQHPFVLLLNMLYAVGVPTSLLPGEAQRGTMELVLSRSVTRTQVYVVAALLTLCGLFAFSMVTFLGTALGTRLFKFERQVGLDPFFRLALNSGLAATATGAISLLAAALFRRRSTALGVAIGFLVVNYFLALTTQWWPAIAFLAPFNLFHYVHPAKFLNNNLWPLGDMAVLFAITALAAGAGGIVWSRRELLQ